MGVVYYLAIVDLSGVYRGFYTDKNSMQCSDYLSLVPGNGQIGLCREDDSIIVHVISKRHLEVANQGLKYVVTKGLNLLGQWRVAASLRTNSVIEGYRAGPIPKRIRRSWNPAKIRSRSSSVFSEIKGERIITPASVPTCRSSASAENGIRGIMLNGSHGTQSKVAVYLEHTMYLSVAQPTCQGKIGGPADKKTTLNDES